MKIFFTEKLQGKNDKNNVLTVLTSVKREIINHIDSSNLQLLEMLSPILKFIEMQEKRLTKEFDSFLSYFDA